MRVLNAHAYVLKMTTRQLISASEVETHPVRVAELMWADAKRLNNTSAFTALSAADKIAEFYVLGYKAFIEKHTFVSRVLVTHAEYSTQAFLSHLVEMKRNPYNGQEQYIDHQANYMRFLFKAYNPGAPDSEATAVWVSTKNTLVEEMASFKRDYESSKQQAETHRASVTSALKLDLLKVMQIAKSRRPVEQKKIVRSQECDHLSAKPATCTSSTECNGCACR